jgi:hypothetical protein
MGGEAHLPEEPWEDFVSEAEKPESSPSSEAVSARAVYDDIVRRIQLVGPPFAVCALAHQFPSQSFRARTSSMLWMASATAASFPGAKVRSVDRDMRGKSARVA